MSQGPLDGANLASFSNRPLSAVLVGADSLLCECGDRLLGKGFHVAAVVTATARVRDWATERGLTVISTHDDWIGRLEQGADVDFLFAITHLALLPEAALALPRVGAFNFHDAPLPDYAGLHCPVWALIDGRDDHGVSWHRITSGIDEGELVATRRFAIDADETSLTLNTKCFEAGLDSFDELADALLTKRLEPRAQDDRPGRLCRGNERPAAACALDFTRSAEDLERLVRALDFGPYPAPMGSPWFTAPNGPVWITRASAVDGVAGAAPGTVVTVDADEITIACGSGALAVRGLRQACGSPLAPSECGLVAGRMLDSQPERILERLTTTHRVTTRSEAAWARELASASPADLCFGATSASVGATDIVVDLPRAFVDRFGQDACAIAALAGTWFARTSATARQTFAYRGARQAELARGCEGLFSANVPFSVEYDGARTFTEQLEHVRTTALRTARRGTYLVDTVARRPELGGRADLAGRLSLPIGIVAVDSDDGANCGTRATFRVETGGLVTIRHERAALDDESARAFVEALVDFAGEIARCGDVALDEIELVGRERRAALLDTHHAVELDRTATIASQFASAVERFGQEPALSFEGATLTYAELDARVTTLAARLVDEGVGSDRLVGVHLERGLDLVVAVLAVQRAGGAYLPLDPGYPTDRLDLMLSDSGAGLVLTSGWRGECPEGVCRLDPREVTATCSRPPTFAAPAPTDLAYCIYTSGSTGRPKGVQVEHRNAVNFFAGMDECIGSDARGTWLAVTSLSFDISVLELLWTLTRGFHVVVYRERERDLAHTRATTQRAPQVPDRDLDFSMFLWGNDDGEGPDKYALTMGAAEFADQNGFTAIWTPERHFHAFGGPFPNPSVISAAIAARTQNIQIRAGSCVVPLHHPLRIAEEWAVVDNISNGRVGMAAASGWQPDDFVLAPQNFERRGELLFEFVDQLQRLWRGEEVEFENPFGERISRLSLPRPVQSELPMWITSAGNPETYRRAGAMGANVLTHLLGQSVEEVAEKIAIYRAARAEAGHDPAGGTVTLMLHAFVGASEEEVRATVRGPLKSYLDASIGLVKKYAWSFPAFKQTAGSTEVDLTSLSDEERDAIIEHAFDRYFTTSGLFGTVEQCVARVAEVCAIGVDEVACLVDYGVEREAMMGSFERLAEVFRATRVAGSNTDAAAASIEDHTLPALIARHSVTHLQCTPSMARMLATDPASRAGLGQLRHLLVGGEALSADLAHELVELGAERVTNMYGPTETTIWSSTWDVPSDVAAGDEISIGDPIANTSLFVLDERMRPVPTGVPGELWIGGEGVVRGYLGRDDLTAARFVDSPFGSGRVYRTGDLAAWRGDGRLRFLGRNDQQVKVRGYRIELGEIEARLRAGIGVHDAVAIAREDTPGDVRLVAYIAPTKPGVVSTDALRTALESCLPSYMVPSAICELPSLPLTPNGKVDRNALPRPEELLTRTRPEPVAPEGDVERRLAETFARTLGLDAVGRDDNFFELGGHSLLVVQLHRELVSDLAPSLSLTDLYRFPSVSGLAGLVGAGTGGGPRAMADGSTRGAARGAARRELMRRRRNAS